MLVAHEDRATPWKPIWWDDPRLSAFRIWERKTAFGMFQRHEWRYHDGTEHLEKWISAGGRSRWSANVVPTDTLDPLDAVLDALRRIAGGHNDPRSLALEALAKLGTHDDPR